MLFPSQRASQPQQPVEIDRRNPIAQGLLYCENPAFGNLLRVGSPSKLVGSPGLAAKVLSTTDYLYLNRGSGLTSAAEMTVLVLARTPQTLLATNAIFANGNSANSVPFFFIGSGPTQQPSFRIRDTAGVDQTVGTGSFDFTKPVMYIGVHSNAQSRFELWLDGALRDSVTPTSKGAISLDRTSYGNLLRSTAGQAVPEAHVYLAAVWGRALTAGEVRSLTTNPWQIFTPVPRRFPVSGSAAGSHTLTGATSTQAATSGTGVITQAQVLVGAGSSQAATSGTGTVTQAHVLVGAGSTQAATSGAGAVTQAQVLVGAGSSQAATSGTGTVTQAHVLVGAGSTQAATSGTGAVSVGAVHTLVGAATTQANSSGTGAVTQAHVLVAAPSVQDNIAGASAIVQMHMLAGAACSQTATSGTGSIVVGDIAATVAGARTRVRDAAPGTTRPTTAPTTRPGRVHTSARPAR